MHLWHEKNTQNLQNCPLCGSSPLKSEILVENLLLLAPTNGIKTATEYCSARWLQNACTYFLL